MKKMHVYTIYMDDGDAFKVTIPAVSEVAAKEYVAGNGDVIAIKKAPIQDIDTGCLAETLRRDGWGQMEIDVITRTLAAVGLER